jgi:sortase A
MGALLLCAALALGTYMAWLFWGTGIGTAREQRHLRTVIRQEIEHPRRLSHSGKPLAAFAQGEAMAILQIPRIHLDLVVVQGTDTAALRKGPGHYAETSYPWEDHGRVGIAGHRTTYLHPFWSLDKLRKGDLVRVVTEFGTFDYHVTGQAVVSPTDTAVLDQTTAPTLVLTTCTPRFSASHRLVVFASR